MKAYWWTLPIGGTLLAAFVAWLWSKYGHRVNLSRFFQVTAVPWVIVRFAGPNAEPFMQTCVAVGVQPPPPPPPYVGLLLQAAAARIATNASQRVRMTHPS